MKQEVSYIKDTDFLAKRKAAGRFPIGAILLTEHVVRVCPRIPPSKGLDNLEKQ